MLNISLTEDLVWVHNHVSRLKKVYSKTDIISIYHWQNANLTGGHLYGKQLFTWLSLVVSLMASFVLSFFPLDVLDEIWDLNESVSEGFLTYSLRK